MHIIVAGGGTVGEGAARDLSREGHEVVIVEVEPSRADELRERGLRVVAGNATSPTALEAAGALHANVLITCVNRDEDALVTAVLARRHFDVTRVVCVVRDDENRWLFDESWGVDVAISSAPVLASLIETASTTRAMVRLGDLVDLHLVVVEVDVTDDSPARGHSVASLSLPPGDLVATAVRRGVAQPIGGDFIFEAGDHVLVVAAVEDEALVRRAFYREVH
jgi:trk/ktr system potassium uptake protein